MVRRLRILLARFRGFVAGDRVDVETREEMRAHFEMEVEEHLRRGASPSEARRLALLSAGGFAQAAERVREQRGLPGLDALLSDFRHAMRAPRLAPGFTLLVVLTLALGLGANTAIFGVVRGVLLKPLPHRDGNRLVYLQHSIDGTGGDNINFSVPEVRDIREGVSALGGLAEYSQWSVIFHGEEGAVRIRVGLVTGNYFEVMGLAPVLGRLTGPADDGPGAEPVAVLAHDYWLQRFGGDSSVVGQRLRLDNKYATVIGVLQPAPFFPERVDALLNMVMSDHHLSATMVEGRTHRMTTVVARLEPGATVEQARSELAAVQTRLENGYPEAYDAGSHHRMAIIPFRDAMGERARLTLWLLIGVAVFVLIISVASVANLTLMRGVRREHELVVRAALGAGTGRLRRLLLAENLLLAFFGAALGLVVALGAHRLLVTLVARLSPRSSEITLDGTVLSFTLGLSLVIALLLTLLQSLPRERTFAARIVAGGTRMSASLSRHRLQRALVVVQVAASVVLLAGAGLLTRTMFRLSDVNTGLRAEEVLSMQVPLLTPAELLYQPELDGVAKQRYEQMRREIASLPGVIEVGVGSPGPLQVSDVRFEVKADGRIPVPGEPMPRADLRTAGPEFFRAAGIPLVKGRAFTITDRRGSESVVIINETLAALLFSNDDPIGKRIAWTGDVLRFTPISDEWRTVVGIAGDTRNDGLDTPPQAAVYMPFEQMLALGGSLVIRAESNAAALIPDATRIIRRIAPAAPIERVLTIAQIKDQSVSPRRLNAALLSSFGLLALIIAAVGIGGVLGFSVSARTNEIGIRMGLGADRWRVQRMILREGGVLLAAGLLAGVVLAILTARVIQGLLFGVEPHDPATFAGVTALMAVIGLLACWIPAVRASRIDPTITMRST